MNRKQKMIDSLPGYERLWVTRLAKCMGCGRQTSTLFCEKCAPSTPARFSEMDFVQGNHGKRTKSGKRNTIKGDKP